MPRKLPSGSTLCQKFMPREIAATQKIVFRPKFQPTMNPAMKSRIALRMKTIVPICRWMPTFSSAVQSTSDKPAAPPPTPLAGRMQPIQPNEYSIMPTSIRKYSFRGFRTRSGVKGFIGREGIKVS